MLLRFVPTVGLSTTISNVSTPLVFGPDGIDDEQIVGKPPPSTRFLNWLHTRVSTNRPEDTHHRLGYGPTEAAPGNHTHDGRDSLPIAGVQPTIETRTVAYTTSSLANNATEAALMDLGPGFSLLHFESSHALRFRAYQSAAHRTADASRAVGVLPSGDHGLIFEDDGAAVSDYALGDAAVGGLLAGETLCPVSITNRSGATRAVTVTLEVRS